MQKKLGQYLAYSQNGEFLNIANLSKIGKVNILSNIFFQMDIVNQYWQDITF